MVRTFKLTTVDHAWYCTTNTIRSSCKINFLPSRRQLQQSVGIRQIKLIITTLLVYNLSILCIILTTLDRFVKTKRLQMMILLLGLIVFTTNLFLLSMTVPRCAIAVDPRTGKGFFLILVGRRAKITKGGCRCVYDTG